MLNAVVVLCLLICAMAAALCVRSFWRYDTCFIGRGHTTLWLSSGSQTVGVAVQENPKSQAQFIGGFSSTQAGDERTPRGFLGFGVGSRKRAVIVTAPHWFVMLISVLLAWYCRRRAKRTPVAVGFEPMVAEHVRATRQ